jgi:hypothetical protein
MVDATFPRSCARARRRWIATRFLADPARIGCGIVRRPASAVRTITVYFASTI